MTTTANRAKRCHECGVGKIIGVARSGRFMRYKTLPRLEIPEGIVIPTCDNCGAEWVDDATARVINEALDASYRQELRRRVRVAIDVIGEHIPQRRLEELLGLSQGYLSKLKAGDRDPSPELVSDLALIARDPKSRVGELEDYWAEAV